MYGQMHPLSQKPVSGKIIAGLTLPQLVIVLLGAKFSYDFAQIIPAIPVKNFILAHIHHMLPLYLAVFILVARQSKTGLPIAVYFYYWLLFKLRRKVFVWGRE